MPCSIVSHRGLVGVSTGCPRATGMSLTRYAPFRRSPPGRCRPALPLDLHVLSLPLAFILSQDQTLLCIYTVSLVRPRQLHSLLNKKEINALHFSFSVLVVLPSVFSMNLSCVSERLNLRSVLESGCKGSTFFFPSKLFPTFFR